MAWLLRTEYFIEWQSYKWYGCTNVTLNVTRNWQWLERRTVRHAGLQAPAHYLPEKMGKTENLTEDRWHTGQDWNCAPRDRYTKPCGL